MTVKKKIILITNRQVIIGVMERAFQEIHLFSWNYTDHDLTCLSSFPDSRTFYGFEWKKPDAITSVLYLATCNRIEIYLETEHRKRPIELHELKEIFAGHPLLDGLNQYTPIYKRGLDSVRHLFQVASGLKSMALGETQITGQLKRDFQASISNNLISPFFHSMMQKVFECQKKVRSETQIGQNPVSLISLLEREILAEHNNNMPEIKTALIGGTGDMSQKAIRYLINEGVEKYYIIRNDITKKLPGEFEKILESDGDKMDVTYLNWGDIWDLDPVRAEIFVTSTSTEKALLTTDDISRLTEKGIMSEKVIIADFGIPQNIDLLEGEDRFAIINLDRLMKQSKINKNLRGMHMNEALPIIEKAIHVFWMDYIYSRNPELVNTVLKKVEQESIDEWNNLLSGPLKNMTEKQKRILVDYMKKQERKALRTHKELFVNMLTIGDSEVAVAGN